MQIEIRKLTIDLISDYIHFFDSEDHSDNTDGSKCYCVCWCSDDHNTGKERMSSPEKRRELAKQYITKGKIQGYLAYNDSKVVGWCNANIKSDCFNCISWLRQMAQVNKTKEDINIKSIYCFTVAPSMKRKGIATQLLNHVCEDAKSEGFVYIEAYPNKKLKTIDDFEGPLEMYKKSGFYIEQELNNKFVMRKLLK